MALSTEEVLIIITDTILGNPQSIKGREAEKVRRQTVKDMKEAKKNGWILEIPHEIQA